MYQGWFGFPEQGTFGLWADDDDVIGTTVMRTYPSGWPIIETSTPGIVGFDEVEIGQFVAWCLSNPDVAALWALHQATLEGDTP